MNVLVTGGSGFIGSHLVEYILSVNRDAKVLIFARGDGGTNIEAVYALFNRFRERVFFLRGDVRRYQDVVNAVKEADVVYHLAAQTNPDKSIVNPKETFEVNILGTVNVLEAALSSPHVEKIVIQSSSEVYGAPLYTPIDEKHPTNPTHPYSASKIAAEKIALSYYRTYGLPIVIARPFNTYGPRQRSPAVIPSFIERILAGRPIVVYGDGRQARDFVYVEDTVRGLHLLMEKGRKGKIYNFATGKATPIIDIAQKIATILKRKLEIIHRPARPIEPRTLVGSYSKAEKELGWKPRHTLEQGLKKTIDYYLGKGP